MKMILSNHTGLDSMNKAYSYIKNFQTIVGKDLVAYLQEINGYPCFKKISNQGFFELLSSTGKVTKTFLSYYDTVEHISKRKLMNLDSLRKQLFKKGYNITEANDIINYLVALYILYSDEAKKEFYFMMYYTNRRVIDKKALFVVEVEEPSDVAEKFILCKDVEDEDGSEPIPNLKGINLLEEISSQNIMVDLGMKNTLKAIIEDQVNLCDDEDAVKAFKSIADILRIVVS